MWYIYTMEYYSAIKINEFESVIVIVQSLSHVRFFVTPWTTCFKFHMNVIRLYTAFIFHN